MALALPAQADERESLETLRETTRSLIDALVESGVLSKDKADALIQAAQAKAAASLAQKAQEPKPAQVTAEGKPVLRVPYVPDSMRAQIRDEVKEEVIAQARAERWGVPGAPSWINNIKIEGDIRLRHQQDNASGNNTAADTYVIADVLNSNGITRSPDFASYSVNDAKDLLATANTSESRGRERVRMRLGLTAKVIAADAAEPSTWWQGQLFDRILLDVPCSATGVIRRHPDIRWLRKKADIAPLVEIQQRILQQCWALLAPGGILLYATCSVLPAENSEQIAQFLANNPDARVHPLPQQSAEQDYGWQILPAEQDMDGFFYARLLKAQ